MAKMTHGPVTLVVDDTLALSDKAGKLTPDAIKRLPKAPAGIGLAAQETATALTNAGTAFTPPQGITAKSLVAAGARSDGLNGVLTALQVVTRMVQEENLLADAACWDQLRQVNDMLKGQVKHHPELAAMFAPLTKFMGKSAPHGTKGPAQP